MSLPWIKLHTSLPRHPKLVDLAEYLGCDSAGWHVVQFWLWCAEFAPDGILRGPADSLAAKVARAAGWPKAKAEDLFDGLRACGFLDALEGEVSLGVRVHDWDEHQLSHIEKAKKDADRKRTWRAEQRDRPRTQRGRHADGPQDATHGGAGRGEERRREEKRGEEVLAPAALAATTAPAEDTPPKPRALSQAQEFHVWAMAERERVFPNALPDSTWTPKALNAALRDPLQQAGILGLRKGWLAYLASDWAGTECKPPGAFRPFLSAWGRHVAEGERPPKTDLRGVADFSNIDPNEQI